MVRILRASLFVGVETGGNAGGSWFKLLGKSWIGEKSGGGRRLREAEQFIDDLARAKHRRPLIMRVHSRTTTALLILLSATVASTAATVESALVQFDQSVRNYNLISFGNASFVQYGDTEGGLAVGGNLFLDGGAVAAHPHKFGLTSDPTLFVGGQLSVNSTAMLQSGYASIAALGNLSWSWNGLDNRLLRDFATFSTVNTPHPLGDVDPRLNAGPAGWNFASLRTRLIGVSQTLAGATANGVIEISGQNFRFKAPQAASHGAIVFDFDASLLVGNTYAGQMFSNIQFDVPTGAAFVVNVRNAADRTLFGSGNFNTGSGYEHLLWNIVDATPETAQNVRFGNGGQFFGAVLAPTWNVFNDLGTAINGQVVAGSFSHSGAELHYTGFDYNLEVPEPGTYGLIGAAACIGLALLRRVRRRAAAPAA